MLSWMPLTSDECLTGVSLLLPDSISYSNDDIARMSVDEYLAMQLSEDFRESHFTFLWGISDETCDQLLSQCTTMSEVCALLSIASRKVACDHESQYLTFLLYHYFSSDDNSQSMTKPIVALNQKAIAFVIGALWRSFGFRNIGMLKIRVSLQSSLHRWRWGALLLLLNGFLCYWLANAWLSPLSIFGMSCFVVGYSITTMTLWKADFSRVYVDGCVTLSDIAEKFCSERVGSSQSSSDKN